jgi:hypothetical protein
MTSLLLDETEDIAIINNSFQLVTGEEEVKQKIKTVLRTLKGECFLNTAKGIPYLTDVMGKNRNLNLITALFKDEIFGIDSVETLDDFGLELQDDRKLLVTAKVNGTINIEETI